MTDKGNLPVTKLSRRGAIIHFVRYFALLAGAVACLNLGIQRSPFHGHGSWNLWVQEPLVLASLGLSAIAVWSSFRANRQGWIGGLVGALIVSFVAELYFSVVKCAGIVGEDVKCFQHKEALMMGILLYAEDHEGRLPLKENWETASRRYVKPDDLEKIALGSRFPAAFNAALSGIQSDLIEVPDLVPLVFDTNLKGPNAFGGETDLFNPHFGGHQVGGHVSVLSGHSRRHHSQYSKKLVWTPTIP